MQPHAPNLTNPLLRAGGLHPTTHQVVAFVRATLDPLHRAGLLSRDAYRRAAAKSSERLMGSHAAATSADFLVREHAQVRVWEVCGCGEVWEVRGCGVCGVCGEGGVGKGGRARGKCGCGWCAWEGVLAPGVAAPLCVGVSVCDFQWVKCEWVRCLRCAVCVFVWARRGGVGASSAAPARHTGILPPTTSRLN